MNRVPWSAAFKKATAVVAGLLEITGVARAQRHFSKVHGDPDRVLRALSTGLGGELPCGLP